MRYEILDSHKKLGAGKRKALKEFFCIVKQLDEEGARQQVEFCEWYEHEYAVKWLEAVAYDGNKVVGYLRCLRNKDICEEWFIGDIHVLGEYRKRHIASKLMKKTINEVMEYGAAERIISSIDKNNYKSIGLHNKLGFFDTMKECHFEPFFFDTNETMYQLDLIQNWPVINMEESIRLLTEVWKEYKGCDDEAAATQLREILEREGSNFKITWCGYKIIGFDSGCGDIYRK